MILFDALFFIDGIPTYYSVDRKESKFDCVPSYENLDYPLPKFTLWNDGFDWFIETKSNEYPERYIIEQALQALNCYF